MRALAFEVLDGYDLPAALRKHALERPDHVATIDGERRISWGEMLRNVDCFGQLLLELGVQPGDRVALLGRNSNMYSDAFLGTVSVRACVVPLPNLASAEALELMLRDCAAKVLVVSAEYRDTLQSALPRLPALLPDGCLGFDFEAGGFRALQPLLAASQTRQHDSLRDIVRDADDDFNVIYSSGTTGVPKGIVHSHATRVRGCQVMRMLGFDADAVNIVSTPLYSNTTLAAWLPTLYWGGTNVLMPKFDAREFLALVDRHEATLAMLVPTQYARILRLADFDGFDLSSLRFKFSTSAPLREGLKRAIVARFPGELVEFYGLTEGGVSTTLFANHFPNKLGSVGVASGCELKIIDNQAVELPAGRTGEIVGRNWAMMKGYLNQEKATADMLWYDAQGVAFLRTGDIGYLDEDGFLYLSDRKKDMIISGGLNIYATDLEIVLVKHEAVLEAAVIGAPSDEWGETPVAFCVLEPGARLTPAELLAWANARLGKSQRLAAIEFRSELPKSDMGKVLKRELRAPYWAQAKK
jgi:acyl-CoA synthetase (AMP-forming)/AMP-acid ligase II